MIQDISPLELDLAYSLEGPRADDLILSFRGREVLARIDDEGTLYLPRAKRLPTCMLSGFAPGFSIGNERFTIWLGDELEISGFEWLPLSVFREADPSWMSFAGLTGYHLHTWYRDNARCGRCGREMMAHAEERALICPECEHMVYPRINPAVIIGLTNGDRIVMSRYAGRPYKGWALLAGFIEVGETPEQAVAREVAEEVGLSVSNIRYAGSQPWGMAGDLLLGFWCDLDGDDEINFDERELAMAEWVARADIEQPPNTRTLTFDMIERFRTGNL